MALKTKLHSDLKLVNVNPVGFRLGWPGEVTLGELIAYARKRLGADYRSTNLCRYGDQEQIEVRGAKCDYTGARVMTRPACYEIVGE